MRRQATVVGIYTLTVTYTGQPVPRSPFKITVEGGFGGGVADASKVKVYGPAIEKPVPAGSATYLVIDCKDLDQVERFKISSYSRSNITTNLN